MEHKFNENENEHILSNKIDGQKTPPSNRFQNLGSIIQNDEEINDDIYNKMSQLDEVESASRILCHRCIPWRLKDKFYRITVTSTMLYAKSAGQ